MSTLVIVESPGKVKTIQKYLGRDYIVKASVGHCYQIEPKDNAIDIDNHFAPKYVIIPKKKKVVAEIKTLAKTADKCLIASDPDREGEAIGWHIAKNAIRNACLVQRISFQEITKQAVLAALRQPRELDTNLFNAQQARAVLDRLVGYKVSPVLWRKVCRGTSAGRVQSIGLRLIVERQQEIDSFKPEEYWDIIAKFSTIIDKAEVFSATYKSDEKLISEDQVNKILDSIGQSKKWHMKSLSKARKKRSPYPIFNTSSLQQFCSSSFNWDGKKTMKIAQSLYEGFAVGDNETTGLITYHRTDSLNISSEAISAVRDLIKQAGKKYLPDEPRIFKSKKTAQEAHEGIRPTHLEFTLDDIRRSLPNDEYKLYEAIYYRFIACQTTDAELDVTKMTIDSDNNHTFIANGQVLVFDGYLKYWPYSSAKEEILPLVNEGDAVKLKEVNGNQHFTKPPAAFNTASLVKTLEEKGIGRPSTYATIVDTLLKRGYVEKKGKAFAPTELGCRVSAFLVKAFPEVMDTNYTARIETQLDEIAEHGKIWYAVVDEFFTELSKRLSTAKDIISKKGEVTDIMCPTCKQYKLVKRFGKFGMFYGCEGFKEKGSNQCKATFNIGADGEPLAKEKKIVKYLEGVVCDRCGAPIVIRKAKRSGKEFGGCSSWPKCHRIFTLDGKPVDHNR